MRISAKARYGLATMIYFACYYPDKQKFNVLEISQSLGISKIYLEQVFTQLKNSGIVTAIKGPKGGYSLSRAPSEITAYDILTATDSSLFEPTPATVAEQAPNIESTLGVEVFDVLDASVRTALSAITLRQLAETAQQNSTIGYMYYL